MSGGDKALLEPRSASQQPLIATGNENDLQKAVPAATKPSGGDEGQLKHLTGARSLLSLWILADHFAHRASVFTDRANIAVDCFIIMSGFVTHWAYGSRDLSNSWTMAQFFARRIGRVLLTTYLAMMLALLVMAMQVQLPSLGHVARCLIFLEPWLQPEEWCPDGQIWTIAALLPSWLLYPFSKQLLAAVELRYGGKGLLLLCVALWLSAVTPSLFIFILQDGYISTRQHNFAYVWPPSQLADFAIGMAAAALARRHGEANAGTQTMRAIFADGAVVLTFTAVLLIPSSGYHEGWEPLFNHALSPLLATFLCASAGAGGTGLTATFLALPPLARVGKYSFEVFLFQAPLFSFFEILWLAGLDEVLPIWCLGALFMVSLYSLSGLYAELVEEPFVKWLRDATSTWK